MTSDEELTFAGSSFCFCAVELWKTTTLFDSCMLLKSMQPATNFIFLGKMLCKFMADFESDFFSIVQWEHFAVSATCCHAFIDYDAIGFSI